MRTDMLRALTAALALLSSAAAADKHSEAAWTEWRHAEEANYAAGRLAVLKAADVRYLKPGETAYLVADKHGAMRFSLEHSKSDVLSIAHAEESTILTRSGLSFDLVEFLKGADRYPVSERYDIAGGAMQIEKGVMGVRLVLFDQERADAKSYSGSNWFDFDKNYVVKAKFTPAVEMTRRDIQTERGLWRTFYLAGHATAKTPGGVIELPLYARSDKPEEVDYLFVSFTDATTGGETYGVGRYLDFRGLETFPPKTLTIDFNRAYNPYCARTPHYNCPLALVDLPLALRVGEKAP